MPDFSPKNNLYRHGILSASAVYATVFLPSEAPTSLFPRSQTFRYLRDTTVRNRGSFDMASTNNGSERNNGSFHTFAGRASLVVGSKWAFTTAVLLIVFWGVSGPYFHFSDTWQLVVNTATTIVTFLIVFLIQNTQNRDARAIHLKLDEIIHSIRVAHNEMIDIEKLSDEELERLSAEYERIRKNAKPEGRNRRALSKPPGETLS